MEEYGVELSKNQQREHLIELLDELKFFCGKKGITWSLAYGTLLGAVRHKGFIPWDDDVDIWMKRCDYERFIKEYSSDRYQLLSYRNRKDIACPFYKLVDSETVLIEEGICLSQKDMGIFLDIFPLDVCETMDGRKLHLKEINCLKYLLFAKIKKLGYCNSKLRNIVLPFLKFIAFPFPYNRMLNKLERQGQILNDCTPKKYAYIFEEFEIPCDYINEIVEYEFEGNKYPGYKNADAILTLLYGDYKQLPPPNERIIHRLHVYNKGIER